MSETEARRNNLLKEKVVVLEFKINKLGLFMIPIDLTKALDFMCIELIL